MADNPTPRRMTMDEIKTAMVEAETELCRATHLGAEERSRLVRRLVNARLSLSDRAAQ